MFFDSYYFLLVVPAILVAFYAQIRVQSTFRRYAGVPTQNRLTGAEAARRVLAAGGVTDVPIERVRGSLTDHYDPRGNVIRLSESVYGSATVAAVGVAAHEAGHALQYAEGYRPILVRNTIIPVANIGSQLSFFLIIVGLLLNFEPLFLAGILCFTLLVAAQLVTLPVEFNASKRAVAALYDGSLLTDEELDGADRVLRAAALTYVAALLVSVAQLLRFILIFAGGRRRN